MDDVDIAEKNQQLFLAVALRNHVKERRESPKNSGFCLNCGEKITQKERWCDADCRDDWQKRQKKL